MISFWDKPSQKTHGANTQDLIHLEMNKTHPSSHRFRYQKQPAQVQTSKLSNHGQQVEILGKQVYRWPVDFALLMGILLVGEKFSKFVWCLCGEVSWAVNCYRENLPLPIYWWISFMMDKKEKWEKKVKVFSCWYRRMCLIYIIGFSVPSVFCRDFPIVILILVESR